MTNEEMLTHYDEDEITHYGVKGMKWGIRRDARILANHRRNVKVRKVKNQYESGKITKEQKKAAIKNLNSKKKAQLDRMNSRINEAKFDWEIDNVRKNIAKQTLNEVPKARLKRGLYVANKVLTGYNVGVSAIAAGGLASMGLGPLALGAFGADVAIQTGRQYLIQKGILDKTY